MPQRIEKFAVVNDEGHYLTKPAAGETVVEQIFAPWGAYEARRDEDEEDMHRIRTNWLAAHPEIDPATVHVKEVNVEYVDDDAQEPQPQPDPEPQPEPSDELVLRRDGNKIIAEHPTASAVRMEADGQTDMQKQRPFTFTAVEGATFTAFDDDWQVIDTATL